MMWDLSKESISELQILSSNLLFAISFVVQRYAMLPKENVEMIGPVTYTAFRYVVSTFLLAVYKVLVHSRLAVSSRYQLADEKITSHDENSWKSFYNLIFWSSIQAVVATGGFNLQQIGLMDVSAGKTSFITGMFVVFVPILEYFTPGFGKQLSITTWIAALTSLGGLFLLSGCGEAEVCFGGAIKWGEVIVLLSMALISVNIMVSDFANKRVDVVMITLLEFFLTTIFTGLLGVIFEREYFQYPFTAIRQNWLPIVTVGFTEGFGLLLANLGQMYTDPSRAALLFSLEVVYCVVLGYLFLHETLSLMELLGCGLMLAAAVLSSTAEGALDDNADESADAVELAPRREEEAGPVFRAGLANQYGSIRSHDP